MTPDQVMGTLMGAWLGGAALGGGVAAARQAYLQAKADALGVAGPDSLPPWTPVGVMFWPALPFVMVGRVIAQIPSWLGSHMGERARRRGDLQRHIERELKLAAEAAASKASLGPFREQAERCGACGQPKRAP